MKWKRFQIFVIFGSRVQLHQPNVLIFTARPDGNAEPTTQLSVFETALWFQKAARREWGTSARLPDWVRSQGERSLYQNACSFRR
jgi:hypothetical protein